MSDGFDRLIQACEQSQNWPSNLLRPQGLKSLLDQYRDRLDQESQRLFVEASEKSYVDVYEAATGDRCFRQSQWNCMEDMKARIDSHLVRKEKDPWIRHVFLSADNSSAPLDCTYDMFLFLCTYHQVPSEYVDLLYSFGLDNGVPRDFHHTHLFQQIDKKKSTGFDIQTLGRSGHEARIGYALSAMEMSGSSKRWTLRQTVIYHSLDLGTGRSFWLTTKANNEVSKRVMEAGSGVYGTNHTIPSTPQASLSNALQTHLITADWCCEGWRWHISSLELEVRNIFDKITAAPIPAEDTTLDPLPRLVMGISMKTSDTFTSQQISQPSSPVQSARTRLTSGTGSFGKGFQAFPQKTDPSSNGFTIPMQRFASRNGPDRSSEEQVEHTVKRLDVLRQFSLKEMQQLSFVSSKLREARMVMGLNIAILKELKEYYISLFETPDLPREIKEGCAVDMHEFKRRISALERFIESECLRCDTLMGQMNDGKTMYGLILEAQNKETEKLFAMNSHYSMERTEIASKRMEHVTNSMHDIALATEQDTASMHIITFFTLIFLPGTFLAVRLYFYLSKLRQSGLTHNQTFFSTPIFGDGNGTTIDTRLLWIFFVICIPLMLVTLCAWKLYTYRKTNRRKQIEKERAQSWV